MAACSLGASGLKIRNLDSSSTTPKLKSLQRFHGLTNPNIVRFHGLGFSNRSKKAIIRCHGPVSEAGLIVNANVEGDSKEVESNGAVSSLIPNAYEVESLLTMLCDTTSIAEFELKLKGFRLYVSRDSAVEVASQEPPSLAPVTAITVIETPGSNGAASSPSLALTKPSSSPGGVQALLDKATDEGLAILQSPSVGYFRRCRTIKGKKAPPSCKEKDTVKEGQVLCYIEQLGGEIPVESDVAGEVVKILRKDGDPVGYGDALVALLPSFSGINVQ